MANQQFDERQLRANNIRFGASESTGLIHMSDSSQDPLRIDSLFVANYDSIDHTIKLGLQGGSNVYPFAVVTLPAAVAGVATVTEVIQSSFGSTAALILADGFDLVGQLVEAATDDSTPVTAIWFGGQL